MIRSRSPCHRRRPPWLAALPDAGPRTFSTVVVLGTETYYENGTIATPVLTEAEARSAFYLLTGAYSLVNAEKLVQSQRVVNRDLSFPCSRSRRTCSTSRNCRCVPPSPSLPLCAPSRTTRYNRSALSVTSHSAWQEVKRDIDHYLALIPDDTYSLGEVNFQLDALSLRSPYLACRRKATSLTDKSVTTRVEVRASRRLLLTPSRRCRLRVRCIPMTTLLLRGRRLGPVLRGAPGERDPDQLQTELRRAGQQSMSAYGSCTSTNVR